MKKFFGIFLTVLLGLTLVACKPEEKPPVELTDADIVAAAKTQLSLGTEEQLSNVQGNIELPAISQVSDKDVEVTWEVKEAGITVFVIEGNIGKVTRPETGEDAVSFTVVATLKYNDATDTKDFALTVTPKPDVPVYDTIKDAIAGVEIPTTGTVQAFVKSVTIIGKQMDGYFISDGSYSLYIHGSTSEKVGATGKMLVGFSYYFNGYQGVSKDTVFDGATTLKSEAEIKAMAKDRTINDFAKNYADMEDKLTDYKRDLDLMGFFKAEVYAYADETIGADAHKVVFRDTDDILGETNFVQSYYKSFLQDQITSLGSDAPKKMTIWANVQEIRNGLTNAVPGGKTALFVYRVTPIYMDVELNDQDRVNITKDTMDITVAGEPHLVGKWTSKLKDIKVDDVTIEYALKDEAHATIFDIAEMKVKEVPSTPEKVTIVATITSGSVTNTYEVVLTIGLPNVVTTFDQLKDAADNTYVLFQGKVAPEKDGDTAIGWDEGYKNGAFNLVNGDKKTLVYRFPFGSAKDLTDWKELVDKAYADGTEIQLIAKVATYNKNKQLVGTFLNVKVAPSA